MSDIEVLEKLWVKVERLALNAVKESRRWFKAPGTDPLVDTIGVVIGSVASSFVEFGRDEAQREAYAFLFAQSPSVADAYQTWLESRVEEKDDELSETLKIEIMDEPVPSFEDWTNARTEVLKKTDSSIWNQS